MHPPDSGNKKAGEGQVRQVEAEVEQVRQDWWQGWQTPSPSKYCKKKPGWQESLKMQSLPIRTPYRHCRQLEEFREHCLQGKSQAEQMPLCPSA